jgi:hypothetical protein
MPTQRMHAQGLSAIQGLSAMPTGPQPDPPPPMEIPPRPDPRPPEPMPRPL